MLLGGMRGRLVRLPPCHRSARLAVNVTRSSASSCVSAQRLIPAFTAAGKDLDAPRAGAIERRTRVPLLRSLEEKGALVSTEEPQLTSTPHMPGSPPPVDGEAILRSVHTSNLPAIFDRLHISLVVSTYQAGKVILIRQAQGTLNTHFRAFAKPMGLAVDAARLAIGGPYMVWEYRNMPAVARKLEPQGTHDACYLPRRIHVTGDIDIHELAWARDNALWLVNTRFSCLCTLDADASFMPRWRPPFVTALAPHDRCHLNGLALVDGRPTYVTALGETDTPGGWRAHKVAGGVLMDVPHTPWSAVACPCPTRPAGTRVSSGS
jgi:hypothetical protein